jgi:hypothetical protein
MPGRVFISCGQATADERFVASQIREWSAQSGHSPYVAIQAQSLADVNSGIIDRLKQSDSYAFVDFRRDVSSRLPNDFLTLMRERSSGPGEGKRTSLALTVAGRSSRTASTGALE